MARRRARMLKLSPSSLSPIRDSFLRESSFFLMCDSTWGLPLPCVREDLSSKGGSKREEVRRAIGAFKQKKVALRTRNF